MQKEHNSHIPKTNRLLNRDGSLNIERRKTKIIITDDFYHSLLSTSWVSFLGYILTMYLLVNIFFATAYWFSGIGGLSGMSYNNEWQRWLECFFFSVQTVATIGYGKLVPNSIVTNLLVTVEALIGMFLIALQTGLVFSRFSKPTAKVIFSSHAVIYNMDGEKSFVFRIANARMNQIVEANVHVVLLISEKTKEGEVYKNLYDLKLERGNSPAFAISWTIVHPLDQDSPLTKYSLEQLAEGNAEILVTVNGIDETFSQNVYSRHSYTPKEIVLEHRFTDMIKRSPHGKLVVDFDKIHHIEPVV